MEQYESFRNMASEIHAYAPDARVLTTYYCGMISHPTLLNFLCNMLAISFISYNLPLSKCLLTD